MTTLRTTRYQSAKPILLALLLLAILTLPLFLLPAFAAVNCFTDGQTSLYLETGRFTQPAPIQIARSRADHYTLEGRRIGSQTGVFVVWEFFGKSNMVAGQSWHWDRGFQPLDGNPWFLIMCGESGTPLRPGQPGYGR